MNNIVELCNITKDFPGIRANDDVSLQVEAGSIHALLGENGAGKSTLMSILFGLYQPTEGVIKIRGKEVEISDPNVANALGIGMVHQHFKLVHNFTVTENIILGSEPITKIGTVNLKKASKDILELSHKYHLDVNPDQKVESISVGMQQRVEILKMLYHDADILIFDEPTAVLTPQEITELMQIMHNLVKEGKTIILITHKLKEIKAVADKCTILRRGKLVGTYDVKNMTEKEMAEHMVGREVNFSIEKAKQDQKELCVEIHNLNVKIPDANLAIKDFNLQLFKGEIFGIAGVDGNGQDELVYALTGLLPCESGSILLNGNELLKVNTKERFDNGIGHVPSDRHKHGLVLDFKLKENFIIHAYNSKFSNNGVLDFSMINENANKLIDEFDIRSGQGAESVTRSMSGGNQQKAIIAREIDRSPDLLVVVQPTRGLDVGAIEYIHGRLLEEREKGKSILLVSFDLDEIMKLSDRIGVMYNREIMGIVQSEDANENDLGLMMAGTRLEDLKHA